MRHAFIALGLGSVLFTPLAYAWPGEGLCRRAIQLTYYFAPAVLPAHTAYRNLIKSVVLDIRAQKGRPRRQSINSPARDFEAALADEYLPPVFQIKGLTSGEPGLLEYLTSRYAERVEPALAGLSAHDRWRVLTKLSDAFDANAVTGIHGYKEFLIPKEERRWLATRNELANLLIFVENNAMDWLAKMDTTDAWFVLGLALREHDIGRWEDRAKRLFLSGEPSERKTQGLRERFNIWKEIAEGRRDSTMLFAFSVRQCPAPSRLWKCGAMFAT